VFFALSWQPVGQSWPARRVCYRSVCQRLCWKKRCTNQI